MVTTLAQALSFDLANIGVVINILTITVFLAVLYFTITKDKVRNFFASNMGIATFVAVILLYVIGEKVILPEIMANIISIVISVTIYPTILMGAMYLMYKWVTGLFTAIAK